MPAAADVAVAAAASVGSLLLSLSCLTADKHISKKILLLSQLCLLLNLFFPVVAAAT